MANCNNSQKIVVLPNENDIPTSCNETSNTDRNDSYTSHIPLKNIVHDTLQKTSLVTTSKKTHTTYKNLSKTHTDMSRMAHFIANSYTERTCGSRENLLVDDKTVRWSVTLSVL